MAEERVVIVSGPLEGQVFPITETVAIGRNPDNTIYFDDLQVSRRHAVIEKTAMGIIVKDLGSGNGTYVGNRRIVEHRLSNGDVIRIGTNELRFECRDESQTEALPPEKSGVHFERDMDETIQAASAENVYQTFFAAPREAASADQLREAQRRLAAVYEANQIIASERDLRKLFARVMEGIFSLIPAHNGVILLRNEHSDELITEYVKSGKEGAEIKISSTIVNRSLTKKEAVLTYNAAGDARFEGGQSIIAHHIASAMCTPLIHQGETLGVLYVDTRGTTNAFVQGDLELLVALSGPAATAIKNAKYVHMLEQAYKDTLIVTANAIEMRDHYTVGHTWRVTNFALEMAKELGWTEEQLRICEMGGMLHDVGKIAVEDAILRKPDRLTDDEFAKMRVHPEKGASMMRDVALLLPMIPYCLYHHERYDGKGYPFGLAGENIPIEGRLIAVADTFDAMTSNRPYRKGLDPQFAIQEIIKGKGTQFDPDCADALVKAFNEGRITRVLQNYGKENEKSIVCPFCSTVVHVPKDANVGDVFECDVCHRRIRLCIENDAYFGERIAETAQ